MDITAIIVGSIIGFLLYLILAIVSILTSPINKYNTWTWDDFITFLLFTIAGGSIGYLTIIF